MEKLGKELEFIKYLKEERRQMARIASRYTVNNHRILRTQIDSLLIAYDQAVERLSLFDVVVSEAELCDNPNCEDGIVDYDYYKNPIYCQVCDKHN